jgi:DNA polymerase-3 subunit beta
MKLTTTVKGLLRGLETVKPITMGNNLIPICDNVWLYTNDHYLVLVGNNSHQAITTQIPCQAGEKFSILVPFADIYNLCKLLPEQPLVVESKEKGIVISCTSGTYDISETDKVTDFPRFEIIEAPLNQATIPLDSLDDIHRKSYKFTHPNPVYTHLYEICFDFEGEFLNVVATDMTTRMSWNKIQCESERNHRYTISKKIVDLLYLFQEDGEDIKIKFSETKVQVENSNTLLVASLVDCPYPDYQHAFRRHTLLFLVSKLTLLNSLLRAQKFSLSDEVELVFDNLEVKILSNNSAIGKIFSESIPLVNSNNEANLRIDVNLQSKYLVDGITACSSDNIIIGLSENPQVPITIMEESNENFIVQVATLQKINQ